MPRVTPNLNAQYKQYTPTTLMSCILLVPRKWQAILFWPLSPPHVHSRLTHTSRLLFVGNSPTSQFSSVRNCVDQGSGGMRSAAPSAVRHLGIEPQRWRNPVLLRVPCVAVLHTFKRLLLLLQHPHITMDSLVLCDSSSVVCHETCECIFPPVAVFLNASLSAHEKHLSCFH